MAKPNWKQEDMEACGCTTYSPASGASFQGGGWGGEIWGDKRRLLAWGMEATDVGASSKATLWVKTQHEGALPPPCVEEGLSMSFSGCSGKPWVPSTCTGDLRELLRVPLRSQAQKYVIMNNKNHATWFHLNEILENANLTYNGCLRRPYK